MVSTLDYGLSDLGSGPGQEHCAVFLGKTLYLIIIIIIIIIIMMMMIIIIIIIIIITFSIYHTSE